MDMKKCCAYFAQITANTVIQFKLFVENSIFINSDNNNKSPLRKFVDRKSLLNFIENLFL